MITRKLLLAVTCLFAAVCSAQTFQPILQPHQTFQDGSGNPCAGCSLFSYFAGTSNPQPTYTDASGGTQNPNPIVLDAAGGANIWIGQSAYKFALLDTSGTTLWTVDNVLAPFPGGSGPYLPLAGGTLTGPLGAPTMNGVYFPLHYTGGDLCAQMIAAIAAMPTTGGTLDIDGLSSVSPATCTSNPFAGVSKPLSVKLGPGKINTTAQWYIHSNFFKLRGSGRANTWLTYTGNTALKAPDGAALGGVLELDSGTPASVFNLGDEVSDMAIIGNVNSPYAMLVDGTHRSTFRDLGLWGAETCGFESKYAVANDMTNLHVSAQDAVAFGYSGPAPQSGICLDGENVNAQTTAATVLDPVVEGVPLCGLQFIYASNMVVSGGTSEENGTAGNASSANLCIDVGNPGYFSTHNTFIGLDTEEAGNADILDYGVENQFQNVIASSKSTFGGANANIEGGALENLTIASTATNTRIAKTRNGTGVTDNGFNSDISDIFSESTCGANCYTGKPWTYRNTIIGGTSFAGYGTGSMPPEDLLRGFYPFNATTETPISNTVLTAGKPWTIQFVGDWSTPLQFAAQTIPPVSMVTSASPTVALAAGVAVTFSLDANHELQAICSAGCTGTANQAFFQGSMFVVQTQNTAASAYDLQLPTGISAGKIADTGLKSAGSLATDANGVLISGGTDDWNSFNGCTFPSAGTHANCTVTVSFATAMPDTSYFVQCSQTYNNATEAGAWVDLGIGQFFTSQTTTGFTYNENSGNNSALSTQFAADPTYGLQVVCHAHHS